MQYQFIDGGIDNGNMDALSNWQVWSDPNWIPATQLPTTGDTATDISSGIASGTFNGDSFDVVLINGGTFNGTINNIGTAYVGGAINAGTFNGLVVNSSPYVTGSITGGTFNGPVQNSGNNIRGGTFASTVINNYNGHIYDGTFNGDVTNEDISVIAGGTFNAGYTDGRVSGGDFSHVTVLNGSVLPNDIAQAVDILLSANHGAGSWAGGGTAPTAQENADATWDTVRSAHVIPGTFGATSEWAGGSSTGTGAYSHVVTVTDGTNPLQNATVRYVEGINAYAGLTDVNGQISFSLDAATFAVAIVKPGYSFTPTTVVVTGDGTATYAMTQIVPTPPVTPDSCTVYANTLLWGTTVNPGAKIAYRQKSSIGSGNSYLGDWNEIASNLNGYWEVTDIPKESVYSFSYEGGPAVDVTIGTADSQELPNLLGPV